MDNLTTADLILKYKELLDSGIITEEEFNEKKKQLLNSDEIYGRVNTAPATYSASPAGSISAKATGVIAYITWIGFLVALIAGDRKAMFHINQALVLNLFSLLSIIPILGWIWAIFICVCWIMGIIYAYKEEEKEVPLLGKIRLLN